MGSRAYLATFAVAAFSIFPSFVGTTKLIQIAKPILVKLSQNEPPRIAFEALTASQMEFTTPVARIKVDLNSGVATLPRAVELSSMQISRNEFQEIQEEENLKVGHRIKGRIELAGGLSFGPETHLEVQRVDQGKIQDWGKVNPLDGTFELISQSNKGQIKVVLVDDEGRTLGESTQGVDASIQSQAPHILYPAASAFYARGRSINEVGTKSSRSPASKDKKNSGTVEKQYLTSVDPEPTMMAQDIAMEREGFRRGSQTLLKATETGNATTLMTIQAGISKTDVPLFPQSMLEALREIVRAQLNVSMYPETGSLLWGRVMKSGKPQSGMKVKIQTEEQYPVIYLNELFIPDLSLKETSTNGYFIALDLPEGMHSMIASGALFNMGHAQFVVDVDAVSYSEIEVNSEKEIVEVSAFDVFNNAVIPGVMDHQFLPEEMQISGQQNIAVPKSNSDANIYYSPSIPDYMKMLYIDSAEMRDSGRTNIPVFANTKVQEWIAGAKANISANKGSLIVWLNQDQKRFWMPTSEITEDQIIYFNSRGERTENIEEAFGALVINLEAGVHTVVFENVDELLQSFVIPVDASITTVLPLSF